jgi:hypothetical protein
MLYSYYISIEFEINIDFRYNPILNYYFYSMSDNFGNMEQDKREYSEKAQFEFTYHELGNVDFPPFNAEGIYTKELRTDQDVDSTLIIASCLAYSMGDVDYPLAELPEKELSNAYLKYSLMSGGYKNSSLISVQALMEEIANDYDASRNKFDSYLGHFFLKSDRGIKDYGVWEEFLAHTVIFSLDKKTTLFNKDNEFKKTTRLLSLYRSGVDTLFERYGAIKI